MVKVKISEVISNRKEFENKAKKLKVSLENVSTSMLSVPNSSGFSGNGKQSMDEYTKSIHEYVNKSIIDDIKKADDQYKNLINNFKSEVDSSESSILDSSYIKDVSSELNHKKSSLQSAINYCNRGVREAQGLANVRSLSNEAVVLLQNVCQSANKTVDKLEIFNQKKQSKELTQLNNSTHDIQGRINTISPVGLQNELSELLDNSRKAVDSNWYKRMKMLIKADPEKAFDKICQSEELVGYIKKNDKLLQKFLGAAVLLDSKTLKKNYPILRKVFKGEKYFKEFNKYAADVLNGNIVNIGRSLYKDRDLIKSTKFGKKIVNYGKGIKKNWNTVKRYKIAREAINTGKSLKKSWSKIKSIPGVGKVVGNSFISDIAINGFFDFVNDPKHNVGHAVTDSVIDSIADIGPVDGAIIGMKFGLIGAGIGAFVGGLSQVSQFFNPNLRGQIKNTAHNLEDATVKTVKSFGTNVGKGINNISKYLNKAKNSAGKAITGVVKNIGKGIGKAITGNSWNILTGLRPI